MCPISMLQLRRQATNVFSGAGLSRREQEIALSMLDGLANSEIALRCGIKEQTVKDHAKHIFEKLGISKRARILQRVVQLT